MSRECNGDSAMANFKLLPGGHWLLSRVPGIGAQKFMRGAGVQSTWEPPSFGMFLKQYHLGGRALENSETSFRNIVFALSHINVRTL